MVLLNNSCPENGNLQLPSSSWAIPAITVVVIVLAVAVALA
jgi:hypothetical protein